MPFLRRVQDRLDVLADRRLVWLTDAEALEYRELVALELSTLETRRRERQA